MRKLHVLFTALIGAALTAQGLTAQDLPSHPVDLARKYQAGTSLRYEMKGNNHGWEYQAVATALVKKDKEGKFYEEMGWSDLQANGPMTLSAEKFLFRQTLSLQASKYLTVPDLSKVQLFLIGPVTDMLTFYSDVFLATQLKLSRIGQHVYFSSGKSNSWADGEHILLGQDAIDFDLTLTAANPQEHTATLLIRHLPPPQLQVKLPAEWMKTPVNSTANNWVQVEKTESGYLAEVGQETFEVQVVLDTRDGKILSAEMKNPVTAIGRECEDAALSKCKDPKEDKILRHVSLTLVP